MHTEPSQHDHLRGVASVSNDVAAILGSSSMSTIFQDRKINGSCERACASVKNSRDFGSNIFNLTSIKNRRAYN